MSRTHRYFFICFFVFVIAFSLTNTKKGYHSDESTYFAITQSIAFDLDLEYTRKDIHRIRKLVPETAGPQGLFLKKTATGRLYYAKSFAYPLFAAPFLLIFKTQGLLIFNGLMLLMLLLMGYRLLKQFTTEEQAFRFSLIFFLASITPIYLWWSTPEIFNCFMIFTGLYLVFYQFKRHTGLQYLAPVFFSIAVFSKPSNFLPIAVFYLIFLVRRQWKKFLIFSMISLFVTGGLFVVNRLHTGEFNYQGGNRKSFYNQFPFENRGYTFDDSRITMSADDYFQRQSFNPEIFILNVFYFIFGKFTGIFIYFFPAVYLLAFFWFQKKDPEDIIVLLAIGAGILFYLVITPNNYFGGSGAVGNRYFLSLYPFLFFLGYRNRTFKYAWVIPLVTLTLLSGPFVNSHRFTKVARWSGLSFPIKFFPVEKTQYRALPTNENRDAFGTHFKCGENRYRVYFLNNHFFRIRDYDKKGNALGFMTLGNRQTDLFIRSPEKARGFEITITNIPRRNTLFLQVEDRKRRIVLKPRQKKTFSFSGIHGLRIDRSWLYLVKVRSGDSYIPLMNTEDNTSADHHGVYVTCRVIY